MTSSELFLAGTLTVFLAVAVPFALTTALRHNDPANRLWCGSLMAALGAGLAPLIDQVFVPTVDVEAAGAACAVMTLGLMWSGVRWFRGATPLPAAPLLVAAVVLVGWFALSAAGSAVIPSGYLAASGFAVATIVELHRGPMRLNVNVSLLQVVLGLFAAAATINSLVHRGNDGSTLLPATFLVVATTVGLQLLVSMRAERDGAWWSEDHGTGRVFGVHSREQFLEAAADRLGRLELRGGHAALLVAEVTDLVELNEAFGRRGGDLALSTLADTLRRHVPAWSVLGYLGVGRFAVLAPADSPERAAEMAAAVEHALYTRSAEPGQPQDVPVPVLLGTADTYTSRADLTALMAAAETARRA